MSNVNANLIKALDGASPQHKVKGEQGFEATEGSDGAQHVKIVDANGNTVNKVPVNVDFPTNQNVTVSNQINSVGVNNLPSDYPDSAVKAELESIKQTQAQILSKLNDTIDTRLTGSKVEEMIMNDELVPAGTRLGPIRVDTTDCSFVTFGVYCTSEENLDNIKITIRDRIRGTGFGQHIQIDYKTPMIGYRVLTKPFKTDSTGIDFYFYNDEQEDYSFIVYIIKTK